MKKKDTTVKLDMDSALLFKKYAEEAGVTDDEMLRILVFDKCLKEYRELRKKKDFGERYKLMKEILIEIINREEE